jgi:sulfatase maturation enzyme AslB (radical SAM superfamily)
MTENHTLKYNALNVDIPFLMMEITTGAGCKVDCKFCPQKTFLKAYKSNKRKLSFDDFVIALDKLPNNMIIIFSGFAEPFLNNECAKMILYASEKGHPVSVFTTGTGMSVEDVDAIKSIQFSAFPHGGFVLHLADNEGYANINVDDTYLHLLNTIKEANIHNILFRTMGSLHTAIKNIFPQELVQTQTMNSRAGYLTNEGITVEYGTCSHSGQVICGRDEYLYNNVMLPNGDVTLCCQDFGMKHILGNLFDEPYNNIVPDPLASFELCKSCHNAINIPKNFPKFNFLK